MDFESFLYSKSFRSINDLDANNETSLIVAIKEREKEVALAILSSPAFSAESLNHITLGGFPALTWACTLSESEVASTILSHSALSASHLNHIDKWGFTSLIWVWNFCALTAQATQ